MHRFLVQQDMLVANVFYRLFLCMKFLGRVFPWQIHNNLFKKLPIIEPDGFSILSNTECGDSSPTRSETLEIFGNSWLAKTLAKLSF
jgi:hypothetical protein